MKKKVIVCDDDEGILEILKVILKSGGFEVKTLSTGKGITKEIVKHKPNLIFLDIWMPGINGIEAAKLLKVNSKIKNIPIIIISALHESEIKRIVKESGADGYISKPFDMSYLLKTTEAYTS